MSEFNCIESDLLYVRKILFISTEFRSTYVVANEKLTLVTHTEFAQSWQFLKSQIFSNPEEIERESSLEWHSFFNWITYLVRRKKSAPRRVHMRVPPSLFESLIAFLSVTRSTLALSLSHKSWLSCMVVCLSLSRASVRVPLSLSCQDCHWLQSKEEEVSITVSSHCSQDFVWEIKRRETLIALHEILILVKYIFKRSSLSNMKKEHKM